MSTSAALLAEEEKEETGKLPQKSLPTGYQSTRGDGDKDDDDDDDDEVSTHKAEKHDRHQTV